MTIEVRVPQLPESVADATLVAWHKRPGEAVARDENLVDLETDKVVLEVPAPAAGVISDIKLKDGTTVTSGQLLALIEESAAVPGASAPAVMAAADGATAPAQDAVRAAAGSAPGAAPSALTPAGATPGASTPGAAPSEAGGKLSPAAKRVAEENKLDPKSLVGSGRDGRVSKSDVVNYLAAKDAPAASKASAAPPRGPATQAAAGAPAVDEPTPATAPKPSLKGNRAEQRVPMTRLRARIAERMVQAQATQALLTSFNEVDLHRVNELRASYKDAFEKQHGVKLGFMSFFTKACVEGLRKFPAVNASVENNDIVYHDYFDIGVAVSTDRGLIVPILRDADQLSFAEIEKSIGNFAARARAGSITMEELTGGTFTITNGGVFGSLLSTPIVNSPQSAILGMHKIQERPVALDGQVVVRPMMYIALTYDHRIIDGREAVQFLVTVKQSLEDPARMVLGI
jgi:2-oxoglutarate dehydrogenase E2 component (dihydrolipoamide succinyltransferase)